MLGEPIGELHPRNPSFISQQSTGFPSSGLDAMPPRQDMSIRAILARFQFLRNRFCHSNPQSVPLTWAEFDILWEDVTESLVSLGYSTQEEMMAIKTVELDHQCRYSQAMMTVRRLEGNLSKFVS